MRQRVKASYVFIPSCLRDVRVLTLLSLPPLLSLSPTHTLSPLVVAGLSFMLREILAGYGYGLDDICFAAALTRNGSFFQMSNSSHPTRISLKGHP